MEYSRNTFDYRGHRVTCTWTYAAPDILPGLCHFSMIVDDRHNVATAYLFDGLLEQNEKITREISIRAFALVEILDAPHLRD